MHNILVSSHPLFVPIVKLLAAAYPDDVTFWTTHPQWHKMLTDLELPVKQLSSMVNEAAQHHAYLEAMRILSELKPAESITLTEPATNWLNDNLKVYLYPRLPDAITTLQVLDSIGMNAFLVHNDVEPITRLLSMYARVHNIPCIHVPHAIYLDNNDRGPMNSDIHDIITASYIACAGPYQAQWYTERAKSQGIATNIIITGLPQYDRLANANRDRDHACRIMNINPKQPVVTYAASWRQDTSLLGCYDGDNEAFMLFLAAAKQLPDVQFVVRTHPNASNVDWHIQQIKESSIPMLVLPGVHLDTNLNATDMLISYGPSNIILEAACVPDIRLAIIGDPAGFPGDSEVVKLPMDADSIAATIQSELSNETCDMSQFVLKYMGPNDGKARHRIVQLVKELVP